MERKKVSSSIINSIGYSQMILEIEFKNNYYIYRYKNISENLYSQLIGSSSIGIFYAKNIKGKFNEVRIK
jgi:hypothetical protein